MSDPKQRRIEFLRVLGRGGFGAVYLAELESADGLSQRMAVKLLNPEMAARPDIVGRQRDEARLLAQLHHHNIVRVYELLTLHDRPAVLMEYVEGVDVQVILAEESHFPVRSALQVTAAVASALDAAHNSENPKTGQPLHVVHRDIKPANILVSIHGGVKILDFGVARGDFTREGHTKGAVLGTDGFIAPEQWLRHEISHAADIFALGVSLLAMLTGEYP
ncbi:MAG: serine/threonine-protein kinase, partial [Myxococcota bacterium]|nr:serine/threonine-protein kinase [Myxococcota bacterium]